jgi:hypothetical protein
MDYQNRQRKDAQVAKKRKFNPYAKNKPASDSRR